MVDVIEVEIAAPHKVRVMATNKTVEEAEAFIRMAVIRRGVEHYFFTTAPAGKHRDDE